MNWVKIKKKPERVCQHLEIYIVRFLYKMLKNWSSFNVNTVMIYKNQYIL